MSKRNEAKIVTTTGRKIIIKHDRLDEALNNEEIKEFSRLTNKLIDHDNNRE